MKKRLLCFTMLLTVTISAITFTNNVKAATKWNTSKSVTKEENGQNTQSDAAGEIRKYF